MNISDTILMPPPTPTLNYAIPRYRPPPQCQSTLRPHDPPSGIGRQPPRLPSPPNRATVIVPPSLHRRPAYPPGLANLRTTPAVDHPPPIARGWSSGTTAVACVRCTACSKFRCHSPSRPANVEPPPHPPQPRSSSFTTAAVAVASRSPSSRRPRFDPSSLTFLPFAITLPPHWGSPTGRPPHPPSAWPSRTHEARGQLAAAPEGSSTGAGGGSVGFWSARARGLRAGGLRDRTSDRTIWTVNRICGVDGTSEGRGDTRDEGWD
ncbi:hypothetical protein GWI33_005558 [Rhynchophorus ferrugineus]|uniref:Uncharacterized protein n=1 Tax=Rhynchophorus ferrugineus TaxID=354439 RepID=A0A834IJS7_RHYFE|nr:hypothetical protein GWI33_005558 [Rhynchophorus ferrugineus]